MISGTTHSSIGRLCMRCRYRCANRKQVFGPYQVSARDIFVWNSWQLACMPFNWTFLFFCGALISVNYDSSQIFWKFPIHNQNWYRHIKNQCRSAQWKNNKIDCWDTVGIDYITCISSFRQLRFRRHMENWLIAFEMFATEIRPYSFWPLMKITIWSSSVQFGKSVENIRMNLRILRKDECRHETIVKREIIIQFSIDWFRAEKCVRVRNCTRFAWLYICPDKTNHIEQSIHFERKPKLQTENIE